MALELEYDEIKMFHNICANLAQVRLCTRNCSLMWDCNALETFVHQFSKGK